MSVTSELLPDRLRFQSPTNTTFAALVGSSGGVTLSSVSGNVVVHGVLDDADATSATTRGYVDTLYSNLVLTSTVQTITGQKTFTQPVLVSSGTPSNPGIAWPDNGPNSLGLMRPANNTLDIVVNGSATVRYTETAFSPAPAATVSLGTSADPWSTMYLSNNLVVSGVTVDMASPSVGQVLTATSTTTATWQDVPTSTSSVIYGRFEKDNNQFIPATTGTTINTYTQVIQNDGFGWNAGTGVVTVPTSGVYLITGTVFYPAGSTGTRVTRITINTSDQEYGRQALVTDNTNNDVGQTAVTVLSLAANDNVSITVYVSPNSINIGGALGYQKTRLMIARLSP